MPEASPDPGTRPGTDAATDAGSPQEFADVEEVGARFAGHGYLTDARLATTVFLQSRLERPVLLEGPAGVGKTELATTLAAVTGRRLLRLQCYEGQDESRALYEWDYGKQLLYTQILREKIGQVVADAADLHESMERIAAQDSVFFSERFLAPRPLLEAIRSPEPVVLLVDEVDRADEALEAVLLELLSEFQVSVPELGTFRAARKPLVVLTSNNTRDLSAALKRRCLHMFLDYPDTQRELAIVRSKDTGLPEALVRRLIDVVRGLRGLELRKAPSISETIDWARTLAVLGVSDLTAEVLSGTANVVVKYERDLRRATEAMPRLVDPNATVPTSLHGHRHGHSHDPAPAGAAAERRDQEGGGEVVEAVDGDVDGREVRAGKDASGRHTRDYYGAPGRDSSAGSRVVGRAQGERSFAARSARRRPV